MTCKIEYKKAVSISLCSLLCSSILVSFILMGCSSPLAVNKNELNQSIKAIEKSINEDDFAQFSTQVVTTKVNKIFKIFTFIVSIMDKHNPKSNIITFTSVEIKPSSEDITVEVTISYNGTINALKFESLRGIVKKFVEMGMPSEATLKFKRVDNQYKLSDLSLPLTYEAAMTAMNVAF